MRRDFVGRGGGSGKRVGDEVGDHRGGFVVPFEDVELIDDVKLGRIVDGGHIDRHRGGRSDVGSVPDAGLAAEHVGEGIDPVEIGVGDVLKGAFERIGDRERSVGR